MKIIRTSIIRLLLPLALLLTACSGPSQNASLAPTSLPPTVAPAVAPTATQPPLPSPTVNPIHILGQLVVVNGLMLAMLHVAYDSSQLQVMFAAKNTGSSVESPSPVSLSAVTAAGVSLKWVPCLITLADNQKKLAHIQQFPF